MLGAGDFRHRNKIGRFTGVEQSEVLAIVGMSSAGKAEWLAAGRLPWRARSSDQVSTVEVVRLMLTKELSSKGWSPNEIRLVVRESIAPVFYNALMFADRSHEVTGLPGDVKRFRESFEQSTELANELTGGPHRFSSLCRVHDSPAFRLTGAVQSTDMENKPSPREGVSLRQVAREVVSRLGRPLLSVELTNHAAATHPTETWLSSARPD